MSSYICKICDYIHDEETLPQKCPYCGMPSSQFKMLNDEEVQNMKAKKKKAMVDVVENSIAGRGYKPPGYSRNGLF